MCLVGWESVGGEEGEGEGSTGFAVGGELDPFVVGGVFLFEHCSR